MLFAAEDGGLSATNVALFITTILSAGVAAYTTISKIMAERKAASDKTKVDQDKQRAEEEKEEESRRKEGLVSALEEWKAYAGKLEDNHRRDLDRHEEQIKMLRDGLDKCHNDHANARLEAERLRGQMMVQEMAIRRLQGATGDEPLYSASPATITATTDGRMIEVSPQVTSLLHYRPGELIGKNIKTIVPERYWPAHDAGMAQVVITGQVRWADRAIVGFALSSEGNEVPVIVTLHAWKDGKDRQLITAEITHRRVFAEFDKSKLTPSRPAPPAEGSVRDDTGDFGVNPKVKEAKERERLEKEKAAKEKPT